MISIRELDWAPGSYQWECPACRAVGNITPPMITIPSSAWHTCKAVNDAVPQDPGR